MTRANSNFVALTEYKKNKAMEIFDGVLLQKELPDYFAHTCNNTVKNKLDDPEIQNRMMSEENRAMKTLEKILKHQ